MNIQSTTHQTPETETLSKLHKRRMYLSAPISGKNYDEVERAFKKAERKVRTLGDFDPVSPLKNGLPKDADWASHMLVDLAILQNCDGIILLDGWEDSPGCRIEAEFALRLDLNMFDGIKSFLDYAKRK